MLEVFQILEVPCWGLLPLVRVLYKLFSLVMIVIPIALILYGTIDLGKAVIASDEKEVKAAQSRLIKRFIYAALVFFVPMLVAVFMNIVAAGGEGDTKGWGTCWNQAKK